MKPRRDAKSKAILVLLYILASVSSTLAASWPTAHGSPTNTGFARVDTHPATFPTGFADVGRVAPGASPVTGPDGTVYIGNLAGEVIALFPDGRPLWKRKINPEHGAIFASPAVGADGSIYVVSSKTYMDHRSGVAIPLHMSFLHKFSPGAAWVFFRPFPMSSLYPFTDGGATTAPPNIWFSNGTEAIMVPVEYRGLGRSELRLIAFSTGGVVIGNQRVTLQIYDTSGSSSGFLQALVDCFVSFPEGCISNISGPPPQEILPEASWPQPGVAVSTDPQVSPYIWLADGIRSTIVYAFNPAAGFSEIYRFSDRFDRFSSPPVALDSLDAVVGTEHGDLKFEHSGFLVHYTNPITAAPTRMADGRLAVIGRNGQVSIVSNHSEVLWLPLNGPSIASAAASCTHLFVSSTNELVTFDAKSMTPIARVPWTDGGRSAPIIGPQGHVYAMTNFGLFVFPPPQPLPIAGVAPPACSTP